MTIAGYPITKVKTIPRLLEEQGYQIWYWPMYGSALNCPLEPLTTEFWRKKRRMKLIYGIFFPALREGDYGDVIILLLRNSKQAKEQEYGDLSADESRKWYGCVREDFLRVTGLHCNSHLLGNNFIDRFEKVFELQVLPKRDEKGEHHRQLLISYGNEILQTDRKGRFNCPRCKQLVVIGQDLWLLKSDYEHDGTIVFFSVCRHCEEMIRVSVESPNQMSFPQNAVMDVSNLHNSSQEVIYPADIQSVGTVRQERIAGWSRAVKRVPIGFDWPMKKSWWGYALESIPCQTCNGSGKASSLLTLGVLGKDHIWYIDHSDDCPTCHGTGQIHPKVEIPQGPGYQLWDTTAGSPISTVFATPEELAQSLGDERKYAPTWTFSYSTWLRFIEETAGEPAPDFNDNNTVFNAV